MLDWRWVLQVTLNSQEARHIVPKKTNHRRLSRAREDKSEEGGGGGRETNDKERRGRIQNRGKVTPWGTRRNATPRTSRPVSNRKIVEVPLETQHR